MTDVVINKKPRKLKNNHILASRKIKDDEFYTQFNDIVNELGHYKSQFKDKTILLNCNDSELSKFFLYFTKSFQFLELKRLISTYYSSNDYSYMLDIIPELIDYQGIYNLDTIKKPLIGNGDFRSSECLELLKQSDIVVNNPPYSLFREYVDQLIQHEKKFLIIGPMYALKYKEIFPLLQNNKMWLGYTKPKGFIRPDDTFIGSSTSFWYTNLDVTKRHEKLALFEKYTSNKYPKYDNADVINVDYIKDIPIDYYGIMGVPVTIFNSYSPEQFKIIGRDRTCTVDKKSGFINGKEKFARIFIQRI